MKSALGSFIVLPFLGVILIASRFGFRPIYMIVASVLGEAAGLFLYSDYNRWQVSSVLTGLASGALTYRGTAGPRNIVAGFLLFAALGAVITGCVLIGHGIYRLARSARYRDVTPSRSRR